MSKRWYVLQVSTGKEVNVKNRLEQQGYKVLVPLLEKQIRRKGIWNKQYEVIFTGYVFVKLDYKWSDYYYMCTLPDVIKILGGGRSPIPLSDEEIMTVRKLDMLSSASLVKFENGKLIPLKGLLLEFKDQIISYKRRQRRAVIEVNIAKTKTLVTVSFTEAK